jgi:hypothetical protein
MMPKLEPEDSEEIKDLAQPLDQCFNEIRALKQEPSYVYRQDKFEDRGRRVEDAYRRYLEKDAYSRVAQKIQDVINRQTTAVLPHEVNSSLDYWFNTKNMINVNLAETYVDCMLSILD